MIKLITDKQELTKIIEIENYLYKLLVIIKNIEKEDFSSYNAERYIENILKFVRDAKNRLSGIPNIDATFNITELNKKIKA